MADLSPQAQAVLDAFGTCSSTYEAQVNTAQPLRLRLAAALRAAADQVVPCVHTPGGCREGERQCVRRELLAIAAELEAGG